MRHGQFFLVMIVAAVGLLSTGRTLRAQGNAEQNSDGHYQAGQREFALGHWDGAIAEFEKAYLVSHDPALLLNLARSHDSKGDARRAIDLFKNYLIKVPKSPLRPSIEERIGTLQSQLNSAQATPPSGVPGTASPPAASSPSSTSPAPQPPPFEATPPSSSAPPPALYPTSPLPVGPLPTTSSQELQTSSPVEASLPAETLPTAVASPVPPDASPPPETAIAMQVPSPATVDLSQPHAGSSSTTAIPGKALRVSGLVFGAVGVAMLGTGLFFSLETRAYTNSVEAGSVYNPAFADRARLYETLQWTAYGVGAGLTVAGAVLYWCGLPTEDSPKVALVPLPSGAAFVTAGRFQ